MDSIITTQGESPVESSECMDVLKQLLEESSAGMLSKMDLLHKLEEECGREFSSKREAILHEIDKYVATQRELRQPAQEQINDNTSLDQIYEVDEILARVTRRKECSGKEIIYTTWKYIHDHNLIHPEDPEMIIADDVFAFVAGRDKISIYEVTISF